MLCVMIDKNIDCIRGRIKDAAVRAGRDVDGVRLVAVTKSVGVDEICRVVECGVYDIGENRVADARAKKDALAGRLGRDVCWHMIGHLQSKKVKLAVEIFDVIQSVDSLRLCCEIDKRAGLLNKVMPVLLEVNVSGEVAKYGLRPEELVDSVERVSILPYVKVMGLMCMAPLSDDPEGLRPVFRRLRDLSLEIGRQNIAGVDMSCLSMGMSQDYEVAIEEGADMVRVGSAIFK